MRKRTIITCSALLILLIASCMLFLKSDQYSIQEDLAEIEVAPPKPAANMEQETAPMPEGSAPDPRLAKRPVRNKPVEDTAPATSPMEGPQPSSAGFPRHIEEIKKQIYAKEIESVEQIPLLDELVQTGDADTREFWGDGWTSVDDWKENSNGFSLEKKDDGTLVFNPDAATARTYTFFESPQSYRYDEVNREFVNEVDYYGKTIYNVAKFINDDVLVMMTISGSKVDMNIYRKDAAQGAVIQ